MVGKKESLGAPSASHAARTEVLGEIRDKRGLIRVLDGCAPRPHLRHRSSPGRGILPLLRDQRGAVAQQASIGDQRSPGAVWQRGDLGGFRGPDDRRQGRIRINLRADAGRSTACGKRRREKR